MKRAEQSRLVEQRRREGQRKMAIKSKDSERLEGQKIHLKDDKTLKQGMAKLRKWFGVDTESGSESGSSDNESTDTEDWNQVDRRKRNKLKLKTQEKNKKHKQSMNASRASHILGISPIHSETISSYMSEGLKFEQAKIKAVHQYLHFYLKFEDEELDIMDIKETMTAMKGDDTLYVAFQNKDDIREIHWRMAECRNSELNTRNYIPPGFYARYMAASNRCSDVRKKFRDTKTQIRFSEHDIEVLTKERWSEEPYRSVDLKDFMGEMELPPFDHSRRWLQRLDRPPRRKIVYGNPSIDPLAIEQHPNKHHMSRQNSWEDNKRIRGEDGMETDCVSSQLE